jgi:hypothetical protein
MIKWFAANKLVLNFDNMDIMNMWNKYIMEYWSTFVGYFIFVDIMKFIIKNSSHSTLQIGYLKKKKHRRNGAYKISRFTNWKQP